MIHADASSETRTRMLLVEDDDVMRAYLARLVSGALPLVDLVTAASAEEALPLVRSRPFDVIVSDFRMGPMNGLDLLQVAAIAQPRAARVLASAHWSQESADVLGGIQGFIQKPSSAARILEILRSVIARQASLAPPALPDARRQG